MVAEAVFRGAALAAAIKWVVFAVAFVRALSAAAVGVFAVLVFFVAGVPFATAEVVFVFEGPVCGGALARATAEVVAPEVLRPVAVAA